MAANKRITEYIGETPGNIYVLGGDDSFFFREFTNALAGKIFGPRPDSSAVGSYDFSKKSAETEGDEASLEDAFEFMMTQSMFSSSKIAVLNEIYKLNKEPLERLLGFIKKGIPADVFVILTTTGSLSAPRKKALADAGIKQKNIIDFTGTGALNAGQWALEYTASNKKTIDREVLDYIISEANEDTGTIKNEIDKLILMAGTRAEITKEDFNSVKGVDHRYDIWALTNSVLSGNSEKAFKVFDAVYDDMAPEMILGSIYSSVRRSYRLIYYMQTKQEQKAQRVFGRSFWPVKKQSAEFMTIPYVDILRIIKEADKKIKLSSRRSAKTVLTIMLQKIFSRMEKKKIKR
ncbi:MAG: DNA polymerase III subunit delta [Candidatus Goldiibacteriota bacterium]